MSTFALFGVNLSGAEFNPSGTRGVNYDYTYPTHAEIDYYASKGFTAIRLPFLWERVQPTMNGALSSSELASIDDVVNYSNSKGIKVILDPHDYGYGYGSQIGSGSLPNSAFANFWGQFAGHFASNSNVLFGLMNEPHDISATQWIGSANAAIAAIRASGAITQQILVPGTYWDGASTWVSSDNDTVVGGGVIDPYHNFAFEVHQYLDSDNSGTHNSVVSETIGVERLQAITAWAEATGNRLFLGEFGVASDPTSLSALSKMLTFMQQHSDVWEGGTYWAAGPWWGNYAYSVEPTNGVDKPQMSVLEQFGHFAIGAATTNPFGSTVHDVNSAGGEVFALYDAILNRQPDTFGLEGWASALAHGTSLHDLAAGILNSSEGQSHLGAVSNADFVEQLYETALHRHADPLGAQSWVSALDHGTSRADVIIGVAFSAENVGGLQPALDAGIFTPNLDASGAARLYYGLLGRAPDAGGLNGWTGVAQASSLGNVAAGIMTSPEFLAGHTGMSDAQFVDSLYVGALGRHTDPIGLQGWTHALATGTSRADVAVGISESAEAQNHLQPVIEHGWILA